MHILTSHDSVWGASYEQNWPEKNQPEEGHNGSCIIKLCAHRLSGGKKDFTANRNELSKRMHKLRCDLDSESRIVLKLLSPRC